MEQLPISLRSMQPQFPDCTNFEKCNISFSLDRNAEQRKLLSLGSFRHGELLAPCL